MLGALLYLRLTSLKNWFLSRLKSLRQPKQIAGALAFGVYFYFFFLRPLGHPSGGRVRGAAAAEAMARAGVALPTNWLPVATAIAACAMLVFIALMWIVPTQRAALGFSEAEIAFLFPAPVARTSLVHFRLLSAQARSLVGATIMTLISNRWSFLGGNALTHALGWWFVFSGLNLHYSGASFTLTRLTDAGIGTWRRRVLVLVVVSAVIAATIWRLPAAERLPVVDDDKVLRPFSDWIVNLTTTAPLGWLLWPFKLVAAPFLAPDFRAFFLALAPALLVIGAHYAWVVRTAVAFEDASVENAQKRGARIAAWKSGQRRLSSAPPKAQREPFRLRETGRAEIAFLWKNLLSAWPYFNLRTFGLCAAIVVVGCEWIARGNLVQQNTLSIACFVALIVGAYVLVMGPQFARQDIRSDLVNADILKTYPLRGWQVVLGEILTPVAILTGILWLIVLAAACGFRPHNLPWLSPAMRVTLVLWLTLLVPLLATLQMLIPNAAALVFPVWFQNTRRRAGPEVAGQRMIFFFAQIVTTLIALLPSALLGALLWFIVHKLTGWEILAVNLAAFPMALALAGEIGCGIWLLGERFEKLDLSVDVRP